MTDEAVGRVRGPAMKSKLKIMQLALVAHWFAGRASAIKRRRGRWCIRHRYCSGPASRDSAAVDDDDILAERTIAGDDGRLAVHRGSSTAELVVWDLESGTRKLVVRQEKTIRSAAFSPDGKLLAISDFDGRALILDPATGKTIVELPRRPVLVNMVQFSPDGKQLLACDFKGTIRIWDVAAQKISGEIETDDQRLVTIALSRDGKYLAACSQEGHSYIWDFPERKLLHSILSSPISPQNPSDTETITFAPDGKTFVTGSYDTSVILWSTLDGQPLRVFDRHAAMVCKVAFSPDGRRLFTSDHDGNVMLWNPETAERLAAESPHDGACYAMSVSPDGKLLATGGFDHTIKLLDAETLKTVRVLQDGK